MLLPAAARSVVAVPYPAQAGGPAAARPSVAVPRSVRAGCAAAVGAATAAVSAAAGALATGGASGPKGLLLELLSFMFSKLTLREPLFRRSRLLEFKVNAGHCVLVKSTVDLEDLGWFSIND